MSKRDGGSPVAKTIGICFGVNGTSGSGYIRVLSDPPVTLLPFGVLGSLTHKAVERHKLIGVLGGKTVLLTLASKARQGYSGP